MTVPFAGLELAKRLEDAEGYACAQYAVARRKLFPDSGAEWMKCAGAYVVFDGVDSPVTQTFGLGLFEEPAADALEQIERFFRERGAPVFHEVSPFAGIATLQLLCDRNYKPLELSNVMYRSVEQPANATAGSADAAGDMRVRIIRPDEAQLWSEISAKGWAHEHPEFMDFLLELGAISAVREDTACFLAEADGTPGAAGVLSLHNGIALFGGAATIPEMRRRGMQSALLSARMSYAAQHGCDLAMMVAQPGSDSQRNAERQGFRIAYTRIKWHQPQPQPGM
jgi:GNAT superfamily N-acetyltransferase